MCFRNNDKGGKIHSKKCFFATTVPGHYQLIIKQYILFQCIIINAKNILKNIKKKLIVINNEVNN